MCIRRKLCRLISSDVRAKNPILEMRSRGMIQNITSEYVHEYINRKHKVNCYVGFDPTASSLHAGNLLSIISLLYFIKNGHGSIALIGGATGSIGDPSGRSTERIALNQDKINENIACINRQLETLSQNGLQYLKDHGYLERSSSVGSVEIVNNLNWYKDMKLLDFMTSVGRASRISTMIARDSVKSRLSSPEGISFTEFTYQLLQGYDFYYLNKHRNCQIQMGGSDQWGNIVSGIDLIKRLDKQGETGDRLDKQEAFGAVMPLLTNSNGEKFGKSAGNAIWLDRTILSPFDFYQFFRRTSDCQVENLLKIFTFLPLNEIESLMSNYESSGKTDQIPQKVLAKHVTWLVHGQSEANMAETKSLLLYDDNLADFEGENVVGAFKDDPRFIKMRQDQVLGVSIAELCVASGLTSTKSQARKIIRSGGFYINKIKNLDGDSVVTKNDLIQGQFLLLRMGKSNYKILEIN